MFKSTRLAQWVETNGRLCSGLKHHMVVFFVVVVFSPKFVSSGDVYPNGVRTCHVAFLTPEYR